MPTLTDEALGTPLDALKLLEDKLDGRRVELTRFDDYYAGKHRLSFATSKFREAFGTLFSAFADNWCQLVVNASAERLRVTGFRFGQAQDGDDEAWRIWQANNMDAASGLAFTEAVKLGEAYVLVAPPSDDPTVPLMTVEHPQQVIIESAPGRRDVRLAAMKKWQGTGGFLMATLYLPNTVYRFQSAQPVKDPNSKVTWVPRQADEMDPDGPVVPNPLGVVPMVAMQNEASLLGGGSSDLANVIPLQDATNKLVADMLVASEYASFRQRWATGVEIPRHPETGQPLTEQFLSSVSRMWTVGSDDAKFGDFDVTDLGNYVKAIEMIVQHIASQTSTPPHYLLGQSGVFPSGEALKATETGLVSKVKRKQVAFAEALEEAMRLAFRTLGDEARGLAFDAETLWHDPESRTESEHVDAILKLKALNVPDEILWEQAGFSPQQIARIKVIQEQELEAAQEAALALQAAGLPPAPGPPPTPVTVNLPRPGNRSLQYDANGNVARVVEED